MKITFIFGVLFILAFACKHQNSNIKLPKLQDTTTIKEKRAYYKRVQDYKFFHFRTVYAGKHEKEVLLPSNVQFLEKEDIPSYHKNILDLEYQPIELYVDTNHRGYLYQFREHGRRVKRAYIYRPLIIKNKTKDTLLTVPHPNISIETKDKSGNWKTIET